MADFTATYLQCQLLLIKVWLQLAFLGSSSQCPQSVAVMGLLKWKLICVESSDSADFWYPCFPSVANNLCGNFAANTPSHSSAVARTTSVGSRAFCQQRAYFLTEITVGTATLQPFTLREFAFLCKRPLECFLLNCYWKLSFSRLFCSQLFWHQCQRNS